MKSNIISQQILKKNHTQFLVIISFLIFLIIGLFIFKDYGISNDEPFQRTIGYYWLIKLFEIFSQNYESINIINQKFNLMYWSDFVNAGNLVQYGILFDTFAAFLEEIFAIKENLSKVTEFTLYENL